jgi:hypothetical protein
VRDKSGNRIEQNNTSQTEYRSSFANFLLDIEYSFRQKKHLIHAELNKARLWIFESTTGQGDFASGVADSSLLEAHPLYELKGAFCWLVMNGYCY